MNLTKNPELTQASFDDFVKRLRHDCIGAGATDHCTADALFVVQKCTPTFGVDPAYSSQSVIVCDEEHWFDPDDYYNSLDDEGKEALGSPNDSPFLSLDDHTKWKWLELDRNLTITGYEEKWEYVSSHFTRDAAQAFIARKAHDYRFLRIYVEAQTYCTEFNAIKDALMDGRLILADSRLDFRKRTALIEKKTERLLVGLGVLMILVLLVLMVTRP
jgi:hypothetical protein